MFYFLCSITVVLAGIFIFLRVKKGGVSALFSKTIASSAFVTLAIVGANYAGITKISFFLILGLLCGLLGDIVLELKVIYKEHEKSYLNAGILCFIVGHLMYFVSALMFVRTYIFGLSKAIYIGFIALGVAGIVTMFIANYGESLLKLKFGKFKHQTLIYTLALSFMSAFTFVIALLKPVFWFVAIGTILIFISDLILSYQYFGNKNKSKLFTILNHAIYYSGQILIASLLFFI